MKVEHSVSAKCKPEHAWQKFQKLEEWPWWNRVIGQGKWLEGPAWQPGSRFLLEMAYPKKISWKATVGESRVPQAIAWKAEGGGMSGDMNFRFSSESDGVSLLAARAEFSGWKTLLGGSLQAALQQALQEWLETLKTEAEKIAREESARS